MSAPSPTAPWVRVLPHLPRQRAEIQRRRRIHTLDVARLLAWHPSRVMSRDTVPLPWEHPASTG